MLLSGDIARHGMAVMAAREGLAVTPAIESDSAPLNDPVLPLLEAGVTVHCLRDLTRGGLAEQGGPLGRGGQGGGQGGAVQAGRGAEWGGAEADHRAR